MKERKPSPVRTLAQRYAAGELDHREYLRERRLLLDDISAGIVALPDEDIPPTPQRQLMREVADPEEAHSGKRLQRYALIALALLSLGLAVWFVVSRT